VDLNHRPPGPEPDSSPCCGVLPGGVWKCLVLFRLPSTCCLVLFRGVSECSRSHNSIYSERRNSRERIQCPSGIADGRLSQRITTRFLAWMRSPAANKPALGSLAPPNEAAARAVAVEREWGRGLRAFPQQVSHGSVRWRRKTREFPLHICRLSLYRLMGCARQRR